MRKTASVLAIAGTITLLGAGAATAAPVSTTITYTAPGTAGTVSDAAVAPGETVTFSAPSGSFAANEAVTIVATAANGTTYSFAAKAGADGSLSASIAIPAEGTYTLLATGAASKKTAVSSVNVDSDNAVGAVISTNVGTITGTTGTTGGTTTGTTSGTTGTTGGTTTATGNGGLANTGIDSAMFLWGAAGIGALGLGAGSIVVARRRSAEA